MLVAKYPEIMTRNPNTGNPSYHSHWVTLEPADSLDWMTKLSAITHPRQSPGLGQSRDQFHFLRSPTVLVQ